MRLLDRARLRADRWVDDHTAARFARSLLREIGDDDVSGMAAEMAYRSLLALAPLLLLSVSAISVFGDKPQLGALVTRVIDQWRLFMPGDVAQMLEQALREVIEERAGGSLTVGLIGTLWGAAAGVGSLLKGLNRAYDAEHMRPLWRRQLLGAAVALSLPFIALLVLAVGSGGAALAAALAQIVGLGDLATPSIQALQTGVAACAFALALSLVYYRLPNVEVAYRESLPGTGVALVGLLGVTAGFGLYFARVSDSPVHAAFGSLLAFLIWLYLVSVVVLVGAEVNALVSPRGRAAWRSRPMP